MTTLVTGATGHLGVNLVQALLARKRRVRILIHSRTWPLEGSDLEIFKGDICDPATLQSAFAGVDIVYHLAGHISIAGARWATLEKTNVSGTRNIVETCLNSGVRRLVHFSSIHALMGEPLTCPVDESRPLVKSNKFPRYDRSKAAGEQEVRQGIERGLNAIIINPTGIIGPYDFQPSHFGEALLLMAKGKLPALVNGGFDWVDARDVAEGAIRAETLSAPGSKYLLSGRWASVKELACLAAEVTGVGVPGMVCPLWLARVTAPLAEGIAILLNQRALFTSDSMRALCANRNISHEKATRELGYSPRPLYDTIADTLRWFISTGKLTITRRENE